MRKVLKRFLAAMLLLVAVRGSAQEMPNVMMNWYGDTLVIPLLFIQIPINIPGTRPWYKSGDWIPYPAAGPPGFALSETSSYHNAYMYGASLTMSNGVRASNLLLAKAEAKKEGLAPLTGKGPASLSFWEWVKLGEMGLKTWGKVHNIILALKSGRLEIDAYKLMPKLGVINEDDPSAPMLVMGLAPSSQSAFRVAKDLANFSDPRFYLGNKINFNELKTLVPSVGVKPSFFQALAHYEKNDATNGLMMQRLHQNFHEVRTALGMIQNGLAGTAKTKEQAIMNRLSPSSVNATLVDLMARRDSYWLEALNETKRGLNLISPQLGAEFYSNAAGAWRAAGRAETAMLDDMSKRRTANIWGAKQAAAAMTNAVAPLETEEYMDAVGKLDDMIKEYVSSAASINLGDEQKVSLALDVADAWVNRLVRDELRAMRQLYAMQAKRMEREVLAPQVAQTFNELQQASERLQRMQKTLYTLQKGQQAATQLWSAGDIGRMAEKFYDKMDLPPL